MTKKYKLIRSDKPGLYRIKALRSFNDVRKGDLGGYVSGKHSLGHKGDCWVYHDAIVGDRARVRGQARVYNNARIGNNARISSNAKVFGDAEVYNNAQVHDRAQVYDKACVYGKAKVGGDAQVYGDAKIFGHAYIYRYAEIYGDAQISGNAWVYGNAQVYGNAMVYGDAGVYGNAEIYACAEVSSNAFVSSGTIDYFVHSFSTERYTITITDRIQIGCKCYSYEEWMSFSDDQIAEMADDALDWWRKHKCLVEDLWVTVGNQGVPAKHRNKKRRSNND